MFNSLSHDEDGLIGVEHTCFCTPPPPTAPGAHLLARRRPAHPLPQRRHNQQEGLPPPLHQHQVPGEPPHQEMTSRSRPATYDLCAAPASVTPDLRRDGSEKRKRRKKRRRRRGRRAGAGGRRPAAAGSRALTLNLCLPPVAPRRSSHPETTRGKTARYPRRDPEPAWGSARRSLLFFFFLISVFFLMRLPSARKEVLLDSDSCCCREIKSAGKNTTSFIFTFMNYVCLRDLREEILPK